MEFKTIEGRLTVCRVADLSGMDMTADLFFIGKTDEEVSLVCRTEDVPENTTAREDGWRGFRIRGVLDFSLVGVLSEITGILADRGIGIFAVSTYNTDYILVKEDDLGSALEALRAADYGTG